MVRKIGALLLFLRDIFTGFTGAIVGEYADHGGIILRIHFFHGSEEGKSPLFRFSSDSLSESVVRTDSSGEDDGSYVVFFCREEELVSEDIYYRLLEFEGNLADVGFWK